MTALLLRLFVKQHQDTENASVRNAIGKLAGFVGIVCNLLLFACKLAVGLLCGAVSVRLQQRPPCCWSCCYTTGS